MYPRTRRPNCLVACACGLAMIVSMGCGSGAAPDGSQINVAIPPEVAKQQNNAYKDYAKQTKKGKPPGM